MSGLKHVSISINMRICFIHKINSPVTIMFRRIHFHEESGHYSHIPEHTRVNAEIYCLLYKIKNNLFLFSRVGHYDLVNTIQ